MTDTVSFERLSIYTRSKRIEKLWPHVFNRKYRLAGAIVLYTNSFAYYVSCQWVAFHSRTLRTSFHHNKTQVFGCLLNSMRMNDNMLVVCKFDRVPTVLLALSVSCMHIETSVKSVRRGKK